MVDDGAWVMSTQMADDHEPPSASASPPPRTTRVPCQIHKTHVPVSHINEVHHVWPLGDGGPDIPDNKIVVCATGHNSIHDLINKYRQAAGDPAAETLRHYSRQERAYALLGWQRIQWQGMSGWPGDRAEG